MCHHCQSLISKHSKICQFCGRDVSQGPIEAVSYLKVPQEDLYKHTVVKKEYKRKLSYLRIFGALALIASLFLPWFGNKSGLDYALTHEFDSKQNDIVNESKIENPDTVTMIAQSVAVPAIFAVAALGLLILLIEIATKRLSFFIAVLPLLLTGLLIFVFKDVEWGTINTGFPTIVFGAILVLVPGAKVPVSE